MVSALDFQTLILSLILVEVSLSAFSLQPESLIKNSSSVVPVIPCSSANQGVGRLSM